MTSRIETFPFSFLVPRGARISTFLLTTVVAAASMIRARLVRPTTLRMSNEWLQEFDRRTNGDAD